MHNCALLCFSWLVLTACAAHQADTPVRAEAASFGWQAPLERNHPLIGRIYVPASKTWATPEMMLASALAADVVLLGEKHDNPDHHRLQAWVLQALVQRGAHPAIVLEMCDTDQQPAIDRVLQAPHRTPADLAVAVQWERSGWPAFSMYEPIFAVALDAQLPILAANPPRAFTHKVYTQGLSELDAASRASFGLDRDLPPGQKASLQRELREDHCGQLHERNLPAMMSVQRLRDGSLAARALAVAGTAPRAVVICGAGHARQDRGAPWVIRVLQPAIRTFSLGFVEVDKHARNAEAYISQDDGPAAHCDALWFTPRVDDDDPCAALH